MTSLPTLLTEDSRRDVRLEASDRSMSYAHSRVIEHLDLLIPHAQVTAIVDPNGCGKSTLHGRLLLKITNRHGNRC